MPRRVLSRSWWPVYLPRCWFSVSEEHRVRSISCAGVRAPEAFALFFGATAIVMVLSMQVSDWHYPAFYTVGYPLCALAFPIYAIRGRER